MIVADIGIHGISRIEASTSKTMGAPLSLKLIGDDLYVSRVVLFTCDQLLTDRLVEAINRAQEHDTAARESQRSGEPPEISAS